MKATIGLALIMVMAVSIAMGQAGAPAEECSLCGCSETCATKIDGWDGECDEENLGLNEVCYVGLGDYSLTCISGDAIFTITEVGEKPDEDGEVISFSWTITGGTVCGIFVKFGNDDECAEIEDPTAGSYQVPGNNAISHISICWVPDEDECYQEETAWAAGSRYVAKGNWATYTAYEGEAKTVTLYAGQTMVAGTVAFSDPVDGWVTIDIDLEEEWFFQPEEENVKIQDYEFAPSGNPSPGLFAWKFTAPEEEIKVPANKFYGVHADVMKKVPCE